VMQVPPAGDEDPVGALAPRAADPAVADHLTQRPHWPA
jgi:hypothetical protein